MTIVRAGWKAMVEFIDSLPREVPAPDYIDSRGMWWRLDGGEHVGFFYSSMNGIESHHHPKVETTLKLLVEHYRPKPRRFAVLVHGRLGLRSLETGNSTAAWLDTPHNREHLADIRGEIDEWLPFDLVERVG